MGAEKYFVEIQYLSVYCSSRENMDLMFKKKSQQKKIDIFNKNKSIPKILKEARLQKGYKISEVSKKLNINESFLKAFEEGHLGRLPDQSYAIGFLKSYAEFLGLDPFLTVDRFKKDYQIPVDVSLEVPSSEELRVISFYEHAPKTLIDLGNFRALALLMTFFFMIFLGYKILLSLQKRLPSDSGDILQPHTHWEERS